MPIDIHCVQCGQLLRVPETAVGKQAKCPKCGAVQVVEAPPPAAPAPAESPFAGGGTPAFGDGGANPFQAPQFGGVAAAMPTSGATAGPLQPSPLDFAEAFGCTWRIFTNRLGPCMLVFVVALAFQIGGQIILQVVQAVAQAAREPSLLVVVVLVNIVVQVVLIWIGIGQLTLTLRIARGQPIQIGEIFSGGRCLFRVIFGSILFALIVAGGALVVVVPAAVLGATVHNGFFFLMFLALIPMFVLLLTFGQYYCLIVDRDMGIMDSLATSRTLMRGNRLTLFAIWVLGGIGGGLATILTCCIGYFFVVPFMMVMMAVIYLLVSGQPMAPEARLR